MRTELSEFVGKQVTLLGKFKRYGVKKEDGKRTSWNTVLLVDLKFEDGREVSDHLWYTAQKRFLTTTLNASAKVKITGTIAEYTRTNNSKDYCMNDVVSIQVLKSGNKLVPLKQWRMYGYKYYKFVHGGKTRWYRYKDGKVERIVFEKKPDGNGFYENVIKTEYDDTCIVKYITHKA